MEPATRAAAKQKIVSALRAGVKNFIDAPQTQSPIDLHEAGRPAVCKTPFARIGLVPDFVWVKIVAKNRDSCCKLAIFVELGLGLGFG